MTALNATLRRHGTAPADVLIALAVLALLAVECATGSGSQHPWLDLFWFAPFAGAIAWLRTWPAQALTVMLCALAGLTLTADNVADFTTSFVVVMTISFVGGFALSTRSGLTFLAAVLAMVLLVNVTGGGKVVGDYLFPPALFAACWTVGRFLRARHLLTSELRERTERLERERDELTRAAEVEERARVARELHDVIAHSMSVMVVQAGAARRVLDRSPEQSAAALRIVESTGRDTLEELRRMMGALRPAGHEAELRPSPRLGDLDALVDRARATGLRVDLKITGQAPVLPTTTDLTIYRVVQEALTNAIKHAGATHASVQLEFTGEDAIIDVRDTGPAPFARDGAMSTAMGVRIAGAATSAPQGLGLIGMRERVELLGGEFDVGPAARGGFRVHARIPLDPAGERASAEPEMLPT